MRTTAPTRPVRKSRLVTMIGVAAAVLLVAGCAGTDPDAAAPTASSAPSTPASSTAEPSEPAAPSGSAAPAESAAPLVSSEPSAPSAPPSEPADEPSEAEGPVIRVVDFSYEVPESVAPGATVTILNDDVETHTVTSSPPGTFSESITVDGTGTFTAPTEPGEYRIVCLLHAGMEAVLVVA